MRNKFLFLINFLPFVVVVVVIALQNRLRQKDELEKTLRVRLAGSSSTCPQPHPRYISVYWLTLLPQRAISA
jgi:hypothetical protein